MKKCNITLNKNGKLLAFFIKHKYMILHIIIVTVYFSNPSFKALWSSPSLSPLPPPSSHSSPPPFYHRHSLLSGGEAVFLTFTCSLFPGMLLKLWYPKVPGIVLAFLNRSTKTFISSSSMNSEETNSTSICLNLFFTKVKKSVAV